MIAEAAAAVLIAMVRPKSTISAAMGMNALASPKASAAAAGAPPTLGITADQLVIVDDHDEDDGDDESHGGQQQREVAAQRTEGSFDRVGDRGHRVGHHSEGERE